MRWLACVVWLAAARPGLRKRMLERRFSKYYFDHARYDARGPHGISGSTRGLTPNLDALAHQSTVFTRAYAQAPLTTASHATILTARIRSFIRCSTLPIRWPRISRMLPTFCGRTDIARGISRLSGAGRGVGAPGFDRGFDTYDSHFEAEDFSRGGHAQAANSAPAAAGSGSGGARAGMVEAASGRAIFLVGAFVRCARSVSAAGALQDKVCGRAV